MKRQNPHLSLNRRDREAALLHSRFIALGYTIAPAEIQHEFFGESMQRAVQRFQIVSQERLSELPSWKIRRKALIRKKRQLEATYSTIRVAEECTGIWKHWGQV